VRRRAIELSSPPAGADFEDSLYFIVNAESDRWA
jgi:hypothetical protein